MKYCLSHSDISDLIKIIIFDEDTKDVELKNLIALAKEWHAELLILNYLLGIIFLSSKKKEPIKKVLNLIDEVFLLENKLYLTFEGVNDDFVEYILNFKSDPTYSLIEELNDLQEDYNNYNYDRTFRY